MLNTVSLRMCCSVPDLHFTRGLPKAVRGCRFSCCLQCDPGQGAGSAAGSVVTGLDDGVSNGMSVSSTVLHCT